MLESVVEMTLKVCPLLTLSRDEMMRMPDSTLAFYQLLTQSQITDLRLAASPMTGAKRRALGGNGAEIL